jgi:O-antigen/teichoic acid export membrane protein
MRRRSHDILTILLLLGLPLLLFWSQTLGGRTLLPTENLYQYPPYDAYREVAQAPAIPHNALLDDLVLQNLQWKSFIRSSIAQGEVPLWNPHQLAGVPFFAAGQQSTLYPFSLLYYVLPLPAAYGWFTVVQLWLAGVFMWLFTRGLGLSRPGAAAAGIVYQLSAFFVISAVFPMIIAAAVWLPLILLMVDLIMRRTPALRDRAATVPWVAIGAIALGCNILAGHVEITYYTLIIAGYYAAARLIQHWMQNRREPGLWRALASRAGWMLAMVALGLALGAVQFIPLFELVNQNFRSGSASFEQVLSWAHPIRDVAQFLLPNVYGNPTHHTYFDIFSGQTLPVTLNAEGQPINTIYWGIKNYVEGALYLGILPLALALFAVVAAFRRAGRGLRADVAIFGGLAAFALTVMFGLPTYALLFFTLPGIDQLHSPFRWVFALTLCVAALAGLGLDLLTRRDGVWAERAAALRGWSRTFGLVLVVGGALTLAGLLVSRLAFTQVEPLIDRIFQALANAPLAFADATMFYSYLFPQIAILGGMLLGAGVVFRMGGHALTPGPSPSGRGEQESLDSRVLDIRATENKKETADSSHSNSPLPEGEGLGVRAAASRSATLAILLALILIPIDLMQASAGFNPASDPALLDFTPPAIEWMTQQPGDWRYTSLDSENRPPVMKANMGWRYGLDDIRGYESIIPRAYVDLMEQLAPQGQLEYNRVAPLFVEPYFNHTGDFTQTLNSPLLDLLAVRYVVTYADQVIPDWSKVYEDASVSIWENSDALPRAYTVPYDNFDTEAPIVPETYTAATITSDSGRERLIDVSNDASAWLVVSESYFDGWRAFIRPQGSDESEEIPATLERIQSDFQGVYLSEPGDWTVRLVYNPQSFQIGAFASFMSGIVILLGLGGWLWQSFVGAAHEGTSTAGRVARNSIAPILLNLFNRGIDMAFALVMLRVLGPAGNGIYQYAVVIFGWFDIFTNFGLNLFLTRAVARDRSRARLLLLNTSVLRLLLAILGVPLLLGFLALRQTDAANPLPAEALLAIGILYVGLLPNSLSTGLSALFYAFERAEIPAAIATVATISKTVFGLAVLLAGYGVVGLAAVSIVTNLITLAIMLYYGRALMSAQPNTPARVETPLIRSMVGQSWPLMLNHFLASIFFQIDIILIEFMHGARMVGQYGVAYKWVLAINVIPSFLTQALLPVMSRQAHEDRDGLKRNFTIAIRLLYSIALPTAVLFTATAYWLTAFLGGAEYLPDGAIALQLMIWSIPIGWMNSLTQYVLIALDLQRSITWAFIAGVGFNLVTNFLFIPTYGYQAAAITTIASEGVLFIGFAWLLHRQIGAVPWLAMLWRPTLAAGVMVAVLVVGWPIQPILALALAIVVYPALWLLLHPAQANTILAKIRQQIGRVATVSG